MGSSILARKEKGEEHSSAAKVEFEGSQMMILFFKDPSILYPSFCQGSREGDMGVDSIAALGFFHAVFW